MLDQIVAGLIVATVAGSVGFVIKFRFFTKPTYLPEIKFLRELNAYSFIEGRWHGYHLTYDPKVHENHYLAHVVVDFVLWKNLTITGEARVQVNHRRSLNYKIRGQINSGNLQKLPKRGKNERITTQYRLELRIIQLLDRKTSKIE